MTSEIVVASGVGGGATELDAFDAALADAGVGDYNLVPLSSVIPADARVVSRERFPPDRDLSVGDPVAVVLASATAGAGTAVAAGLGWSVAPEGGVFFEADGRSASACRGVIEASLDGARARRDWAWDRGDTAVRTETHGADGTTAAVVVAVYGALALDPLPATE